MVDYIKGSIQSVNDDSVVVDIGNLGLKIHVPLPSAFKVEEEASLYIYMHWNQENGPSLFGFTSELEKTVFLLVITCSGVGPKIGLSVLLDLGPQAFLEAIQTGNDKALSKVSGIGAKKAEQMIVQLKHKVAKLAKSGILKSSGGTIGKMQEVADVLASLHYSRFEVNAAMKHLNDAHTGSDQSFDQLVRHALSFLSKKSVAR